MKRTFTFLRQHWESLLFLAGLMIFAFLGGIAYATSEIDSTIAEYIEANGCPVKGEDW
ncbi:hypothetical protein [Marinobacter nauticus]|uniref:hypothetical protein n=1 Tax=Marinobacter nauticus TaxID=2743 RepID=UPI0002DB6DC7|nr:hypothetical protein [Marinobacter nauticus]MBW3199604.1 hypothetical protein [Marinobacter nauticus]MBY6185016.1 hypothetical protein [Marinobacter nauticus]